MATWEGYYGKYLNLFLIFIAKTSFSNCNLISSVVPNPISLADIPNTVIRKKKINTLESLFLEAA